MTTPFPTGGSSDLTGGGGGAGVGGGVAWVAQAASASGTRTTDSRNARRIIGARLSLTVIGLPRVAAPRALVFSTGMTKSTARAPVGRRVRAAGSRFPLGRTSCPDEGARHPLRACRDPRPPGHSSPRRSHRRVWLRCQRSEEHTSELQSTMRTSYAVL